MSVEMLLYVRRYVNTDDKNITNLGSYFFDKFHVGWIGNGVDITINRTSKVLSSGFSVIIHKYIMSVNVMSCGVTTDMLSFKIMKSKIAEGDKAMV